jgi:hypothetical protein
MSAQPVGEQEVIGQLPAILQRWLTLERCHLHKAEIFQNRSRDPGFDSRYFPQNCGVFALPCYWVQRKHLLIYSRSAADEQEWGLVAGESLNERVLFPIHPASIDNYAAFLSEVRAEDAANEGLRIWAVPTSSTRTLLAWPDGAAQKALFVKLSLHSPILGDRRLYTRTVARSVGLSGLMRDSQADLPATIDHFPESLGFVPRHLPDSGVLIRSIPQEIKQGRTLVAPLFSLLGGSGIHVPLLLTLLERSDMEPRQWLEEILCAPFAKLWLEMSLRFGLILEAHGQDLMLALSPDLKPLGRFYYRDFEGLQVDWELRRRRGLPACNPMPHSWRWRETYDTWGYPHGECAWYKLQISLMHYLHFVLNEVELSLRQWHERGLVRGATFEEGEVTMLFSRHLFEAIQREFGIRAAARYNIYRSLNKFTIFLMKVRRESGVDRGAQGDGAWTVFS